MTVGPVEIFVIAFKDPAFHSEIRAELERLRDGEEGMELGAVWGLRELADGHVFDDEDKWRVADAIEPGEGALVALVEHRWAIPVREAVRRAGGHAVAGRWIADRD